MVRLHLAGAPLTEDQSRLSQAAPVEERISNREEVELLLQGLNEAEADVVRMYHLEGKSYREISSQVGMPENSVGPTLTRAREKMKRAGTESN